VRRRFTRLEKGEALRDVPACRDFPAVSGESRKVCFEVAVPSRPGQTQNPTPGFAISLHAALSAELHNREEVRPGLSLNKCL
jgi:hypothetical protein